MGGRRGKIEMALAADRSLPALLWDWTDLSARSQENAATIARGRSANGQVLRPGAFSHMMDNADSALTPRHPLGQYYPLLTRGVPIRYSVQGEPFLRALGLPGAGMAASTPDGAAVSITGDVSGMVQVHAPLIRPGSSPAGASTESASANLVVKWVLTGDQRSYRFGVTFDGALGFAWSDDGTLAGVASERSDLCPTPPHGPLCIGWEFDADNGLGGYTVRFYAWRGSLAEALANLDLALLTEVVNTTAGAQTIFDSTASLAVGGNLSTLRPWVGDLDAMVLHSGDLATGTPVASPDFAAQAVGASSFPDSAGRTWTIGSAGEIIDYRPRFVGELASTEPVWPGAGTPGTAQVRWTAAGTLRRMRQNAKPLDSPMRRTIGSRSNAGQVYAYWPMDDGRDATQASSASGGTPLVVSGDGVNFASDDTCPGSEPVATFRSGEVLAWSGAVPTPAVLPTSWRVEQFVKITPTATRTAFNVYRTTGNIKGVAVTVDTTLGLLVIARDADGSTIDFFGNGWLPEWDGRWLYVTVHLEQVGGNVEANLNIVVLEGPDQGSAFGSSDTWVGRTLGRVAGVVNLTTPPAGDLAIGNIIVADGALPVGWLANADTGWVNESASRRFYRLCVEEEIPVYVDGPHQGLLDGLEDGVASMGPQRALPLLDLLQECVKADHGLMGESVADLGLTYRTGASLVNQEPRLVVGSELTRGFNPMDDDQGLVNELTVERTNGSRVLMLDEESIEEADRYVGSETVNLAEDVALVPWGGMRLAIATWPEMRYPSIPIELTKNDALQDEWMETFPGDVIVCDDLPAEHPSNTLTQLLDGYTETISPVRYQVRATTTPAGPWNTGVADTDGTPDTDLGSIDTDGSELASSLTDSALSMSVAVTAGELWTTDAADFPLDVEVGGEVVTVSAISGASSPQTFTLSARAVNARGRAHSAGEPVRVAHPLLASI